MKRIVLLLSVSLLSAQMSFAQVTQDTDGDLQDLLNQSVDDGKKLISAYLNPLMMSVPMALNQGWYNTAAAHKVGGIDLTITANAMMIPKSDIFFDVTKLDLDVLRLDETSPDYPNSPTIFGPDRAPVFSYTDETTGQTQTFSGPGGLDIEGEIGKNLVPVPLAHLGIGLPKGTDLKLRYAPTIDIGDGSLNVFGVGVLHDIKQWIPGIKLLPFSLSAFAAHTSFKMDMQLDPEDAPDQRGLFKMSATTVQGLISKKFSILTLYGGLGYNMANSSLALKGNYDINDDGTIQAEEVDPVDLDFSSSSFRATAGMRLKLAILTLHADYTVQKYNCLTVGLGFSFRESK